MNSFLEYVKGQARKVIMYKERSYRQWIQSEDLVSFEVKDKETDLFIAAKKNLEEQARKSVLNNRLDIERYIINNSNFYTSLEPVPVDEKAPDIVRSMSGAARKAGVGPMAAVAGAIAEFVGRDLAAFTDEVIVENGGDIFILSSKKRVLGIYAGDASPFTGKMAMEIDPAKEGIGVCTSSGTVSHSLSFGNVDAAIIISNDTALADAVATQTANLVKGPESIEKAIDYAKSVKGIKGVVVIIGDKMGSWGEVSLV